MKVAPKFRRPKRLQSLSQYKHQQALTIAVIQNRTYMATIITVQLRPAYTSVVAEVELLKNQN